MSAFGGKADIGRRLRFLYPPSFLKPERRSTAAAWPFPAVAQQPRRLRQVGVLLALDERDPEGQARIATFRQELQRLGWEEGRNLKIDARWPGADMDRIKRDAAELVRLAPDVIFINSQPGFDAMRQATRTIPVVFVQVTILLVAA
jgi:putative tryptophan/tyrosine transport system substrate-binding protein